MAAHNELGQWGEQKASEYLEQKGYRIIERDWHIGHRDIDIVAIDGCTMVFVEVRTRSDNYLISPEESVNRKKIQSVTLAANAYIKIHRVNLNVRFDVVAITVTTKDIYKINHVENAFRPLPVYRGYYRRY